MSCKMMDRGISDIMDDSVGGVRWWSGLRQIGYIVEPFKDALVVMNGGWVIRYREHSS